ncbi:MAG: cytochrome c maturation protein CcmE [Bacteroidetes bacterium]|nr:cytochrome c maturation protein CcmE [Bacteroidota bacterium]MBS1973663.1 cytochrome c maturation protein CcmE [Bacteroidota bacterium]
MKKTHIIILIFIAIAIAALVSFMGSLSTYETIASARQKEGKSVTLYVNVDHSQVIDYDPAKDPNYFAFHVTDTLGNKTKVVCNFEKPYDFDKAEAVTLKGKMEGDIFRISGRDGILLKCPSKYKDDPNMAKKNLSQN